MQCYVMKEYALQQSIGYPALSDTVPFQPAFSMRF
jgi:hypothetical protein